jgi:hypothetical protein
MTVRMILRGWNPPPGAVLPVGNGGGAERVTGREIVDESGGSEIIIAADVPAAMRTKTRYLVGGCLEPRPSGPENCAEKIVAYCAAGR